MRNSTGIRWKTIAVCLTVLVFCRLTPCPADDLSPEPQAGSTGETSPAAPQARDLPTLQQQLQRDYDRFQRSLYEVGEATRGTDPVRAELLLRAHNESRAQDILRRLEVVAGLLQDRRYGESIRAQELLIAEMEALLKLLQSEDERQRLQAEIERLEDLLKDTNRLIGEQKDVRADTERGGQPESLEEAQRRVADHARDLADKIDRQDAERGVGSMSPGEGSNQGTPPSGSGQPSEEGSQGEGRPGEPGSEQPPGEASEGEGPPGSEGSTMEPMGPGMGDSGEGSPSESSPSEPQSGEGSPSESSPSEGSSSSGTPSEGSPSEGSPSEGSPSQGSSSDQQSSQSPQEIPPLNQPPGGSPSGATDQSSTNQQTPGRQELEQARREMEDAIKELEGRRLDSASDEQDAAVAQLERMKAQLEEILRQLREKEKELFLQMLEARFQQMLQAQLIINSETLQLAQIDDPQPRHIARAKQLSRDEQLIVLEAEKALNLLREEGSSVAFPEAVEQMRDNMLEVVRRLDLADTGPTTQLIEELIVETLEEMIFALQREMERLKQQGGEPPPPGEPQDPALVDLLAELKMIRSLQSQVNRLTRALGMEIDGEQTFDPEQLQLLEDLARRQQRIQQATYDLHTGRSELGGP